MIGLEGKRLHSRRLTLRLVQPEDGPALRTLPSPCGQTELPEKSAAAE